MISSQFNLGFLLRGYLTELMEFKKRTDEDIKETWEGQIDYLYSTERIEDLWNEEPDRIKDSPLIREYVEMKIEEGN